MLPHSDHSPSERFQVVGCVAITSPIGRQLVAPPCAVVLRGHPVIRTSVPETTVNENCHFPGRKGHIDRASRHPRYRITHSVPPSIPVQSPSQLHLGSSVLASLGHHSSANRLRRRLNHAAQGSCHHLLDHERHRQRKVDTWSSPARYDDSTAGR